MQLNDNHETPHDHRFATLSEKGSSLSQMPSLVSLNIKCFAGTDGVRRMEVIHDATT